MTQVTAFSVRHRVRAPVLDRTAAADVPNVCARAVVRCSCARVREARRSRCDHQ